MDAGLVLGGLSLSIHFLEKFMQLLHHFKFTSKCCGKGAELTIDTSPLSDSIHPPEPVGSSAKPPSQ